MPTFQSRTNESEKQGLVMENEDGGRGGEGGTQGHFPNHEGERLWEHL